MVNKWQNTHNRVPPCFKMKTAFSQKCSYQNLKHLTGDWYTRWLTFRNHGIVKVKPYVWRPALHLTLTWDVPLQTAIYQGNRIHNSHPILTCNYIFTDQFVGRITGTIYWLTWIWVSKMNAWTMLLHCIKQMLKESKYNTSTLNRIQANKKH